MSLVASPNHNKSNFVLAQHTFFAQLAQRFLLNSSHPEAPVISLNAL
jgi:hypothetical protein